MSDVTRVDSPPPREARVAIVMVNWNGWRECVECLDSVLVQRHQSYHVLIVDNDSQDGSLEHIAAWCSRPVADPAWCRHEGVDRLTDLSSAAVSYRIVERSAYLPPPLPGCRLTLIRSGGNLGFAGGCNVGIVAAGLDRFDYFWFLNADTVVERGALVELVRRAERDADVGIVGSTIRFYDRPDVIQAMGGGRLDPRTGMTPHIGDGASLADVPPDGAAVERELDYVMGASMLVSSRYVAEIGLMEEDYFLYYEDADWALRGRGRFALGYAPRSSIFHKWGANSHQAAHIVSNTYYYRNRLRFVARFLPERLAAAKRGLFEQMVRHVLRGRWRAAQIVFSTLLMARALTASVRQPPS